MHQVSGSELDANLGQLAELVPIEFFDDGWNHGMVYGNVTVAYLNEENFLNATVEDRARALRQAYISCLRSAIDRACELLEEIAIEELTDQYRNVTKQVVTSIEQGHAVLDHNGP